jgi:hypothetical protein
MADVFVGGLLRDPDSKRISGITFAVQLAHGQAQVSILEAPPSIDLSQPDTFRLALGEIGKALMEAAQTPERLHWHPHQQP